MGELTCLRQGPGATSHRVQQTSRQDMVAGFAGGCGGWGGGAGTASYRGSQVGSPGYHGN